MPNDFFLQAVKLETQVSSRYFFLLKYIKGYHLIYRRDSISRPIAPVSSVVGGDDTTRPRRQGLVQGIYFKEVNKV
jgi:hypothetical protein